MGIHVYRGVLASAVCVVFGSALLGCGGTEKPGSTRMHLANESDFTLVFLAIEDSEMEASTASNRLPRPLPPHAVFSAVLSRPGNYWVRTETESGGSIIRRIEGPVRLGLGIHDWEYTAEDEAPLYRAAAGDNLVALAAAKR